jgi:transcriptional regulator with XRE-family HTH domain
MIQAASLHNGVFRTRFRSALMGKGRLAYQAPAILPTVKAQERSWKAVGEFIRSQRRLADLSLRQLSALAKVSNPYLSQIERGIHKPSAEVLKGIADALHISAETLYARAGLLDEEHPEQDGTSVERAIRMDGRLSNEQKKALIRVYRSFLGTP